MTKFTAKDATYEQWQAIVKEQEKRNVREYGELVSLLERSNYVVDGFGIGQLDHNLQVATRAKRGGESEELVFVALVHDAAKPLNLTYHPDVIAEIVKEYVSHNAYSLLKYHGVFLADIVHKEFTGVSFRDQEWYEEATRLAGYDSISFDPEYDSMTLEDFLPLIKKVYNID